MAERQIEAKEVLDDIRREMDDRSLMEKYVLSAEELRHLLQKLVHAGLIELAELDDKMPAFMGTCFIDAVGYQCREEVEARIHEAEVLKDVRSGLDEHGIREKHGISREAFQSLLGHLLLSGLIKRSEVSAIKRRRDSAKAIELHAAAESR
jgi:hypothetical protein